MSLSLNEVEAMARKAVRGAGYSWGLAEEAGAAVRWLSVRGLDGCGVLARLLEVVDGAVSRDRSPVVNRTDWARGDGPLCPIMTGAALSDHAAMLPSEVSLGPVAQPLLLAPFAALVAGQIETPVTLIWPEGEMVVASGLGGPVPPDGARMTVKTGGDACPRTGLRDRADPAPEAWRILGRFAHRTHAPATDASRAKGAGAGLSDND